MKKRIVCMLMSMMLLIGTTAISAGAMSFFDIDPNESYAEAVEFVSNMEIMVGDGEGNFDPDRSVSRAEMAIVICKMMGETGNLTNGIDFSDVPTSHWANAYITKAVELGIISGYNGKFNPTDTVTFEQAATMLVCARGGKNMANQYGGYPNGYLTVFRNYGLANGIAKTKGDLLDRADVAVILYNYVINSSDMTYPGDTVESSNTVYPIDITNPIVMVDPTDDAPDTTNPAPVVDSFDWMDLVGTWEIDVEYTNRANEYGLRSVFGSAFSHYGSAMKILPDQSFSYYIGAGIGGKGSWTYHNNALSYEITVYEEDYTETGTLFLTKTDDNEPLLVMDWDVGYTYKVHWKKIS